jgi:membrane associated rhomboid family serine protease
MFMHDIGTPDKISIAHIGMNMLILFMFGPMVENVWGPKKFLMYYILTGIGAALAHYAILYFQIQPDISFLTDYINAKTPEEMQALLATNGGSNYFSQQFVETIRSSNLTATETIDLANQFRTQIVNGPVIIGASGAVFGILLAYGMLFPDSILYVFLAIPMKAKYAVIFFGVLELYLGIAGGDNVAHFAHLGGLITGLIIIFIWRYNSRRRRDDFFNN